MFEDLLYESKIQVSRLLKNVIKGDHDYSHENKSMLITTLKPEFDMTALGWGVSLFLGILVTHKPMCMFWSQHKYVEEILKRANTENCKLVATPIYFKLQT